MASKACLIIYDKQGRIVYVHKACPFDLKIKNTSATSANSKVALEVFQKKLSLMKSQSFFIHSDLKNELNNKNSV